MFISFCMLFISLGFVRINIFWSILYLLIFCLFYYLVHSIYRLFSVYTIIFSHSFTLISMFQSLDRILSVLPAPLILTVPLFQRSGFRKKSAQAAPREKAPGCIHDTRGKEHIKDDPPKRLPHLSPCCRLYRTRFSGSSPSGARREICVPEPLKSMRKSHSPSPASGSAWGFRYTRR